MKISNSKRQLAQLLIEAGVTQFPKDANWAAQDKDDGRAWFHNCKDRPNRFFRRDYWDGSRVSSVQLPTLIPNWHQDVLSRDEFDQIIAETAVGSEPDSDGWIEWKGGECPVGKNISGDIKLACGEMFDTVDMAMWNWEMGNENPRRIIAYRLHKPEQTKSEYCESVTRSIPDPVAESKPTIEQLAADYRNLKDYADRKQREADAANAEAKAKLVELVAAGNALNLVISVEDKEPELVITNWRDLQIDDEIEVVKSKNPAHEGKVGVVSRFDKTNDLQPVRVIFGGNERCYSWPTEWRFIRRPTK